MNEIIKGPHRWKPGQSGNPSGRPAGARSKFSEAFMRDLAKTWAERGGDIVEMVATTEPARFLAVAASLIPKDVSVSLTARLPGNMEPDDWAIAVEVFGAIKQTLPDAAKRQLGEVLEFVAEAIRAHDAKLIECDKPQHEPTTD
jgi:hypothetical protein